MNRADISSKLVHLTKGETIKECLETLLSILRQGKLIGGNGMIKGGYKCVCFSEAPITSVSMLFDHREAHGFRYQPLGISVDKDWIYQAEGRPVIYQPDCEFDLLPEALRYRHVGFDPTRKPKPIDFTWEREWRLHKDELILDPSKCSVIVPRRRWIKSINGWLEKEQLEKKWTFLALEDLGFKISVPVETKSSDTGSLNQN